MRLTNMIRAYEADTNRILTNFNAKCPDCGDFLEEDDCYDTITTSSWVEHLIVGHCPTCDKSYQWRNVFLYTGISELEESEE